jgi:choline dehydrogenase-like flavoprotein
LEDYNAEEQEGFGAQQHTIFRGRRWGNAEAFLEPALGRDNVQLATSAFVTKLLIDGNRVSGVEYSHKGTLQRAHAARDVILCAGTYNSPQILMLSGIGPADHLTKVGIRVIQNMPAVGHNLWDHPTIAASWIRKGDGYIHRTLRLDRLALSLLRGLIFRKGFACEHFSSGTAFVRSKSDVTVPDLQLFCRDATRNAHEWFPLLYPPAIQGISLNCAHVRPQSRGKVELNSDNPMALARVVNNFLSCEEDRQALREGFRCMRSVMEDPAMKELVAGNLQPVDCLESDEDIDRYVRRTVATLFHPGGTCRMGVDDQAVVDPEFRLRGFDGLRIIDASVIPAPIGGNINAAVTVFAEKASDILRGLPAMSPLPV